jgi:hypothetical protein
MLRSGCYWLLVQLMVLMVRIVVAPGPMASGKCQRARALQLSRAQATASEHQLWVCRKRELILIVLLLFPALPARLSAFKLAKSW